MSFPDSSPANPMIVRSSPTPAASKRLVGDLDPHSRSFWERVALSILRCYLGLALLIGVAAAIVVVPIVLLGYLLYQLLGKFSQRRPPRRRMTLNPNRLYWDRPHTLHLVSDPRPTPGRVEPLPNGRLIA